MCTGFEIAALALVAVLGTGMLATTAQPVSAHSAVSNSTVCQQYSQTIGAVFSYGVLSVAICHNGYNAWVNSGVGCRQIVLPPFSFNRTTWCGVSANNGAYAEVGENYYVNAFGGQYTQYVRLRVYYNGNVGFYGGI